MGGSFFAVHADAAHWNSPHPKPIPTTMLRIAGGGEECVVRGKGVSAC